LVEDIIDISSTTVTSSAFGLLEVGE